MPRRRDLCKDDGITPSYGIINRLTTRRKQLIKIELTFRKEGSPPIEMKNKWGSERCQPMGLETASREERGQPIEVTLTCINIKQKGVSQLD
jgi:hypothetical protein